MSTSQFVRRDGRRFMVGDQEFKFVGFNIRGLAHYGYPEKIVSRSTVEQREGFLAEAQAVGSAVIRVFLPHCRVRSDDALVDRLGVVLENAEKYKQRVIVCLNDHLETSKFQHYSFFDDGCNPLDGYIYTDKHNHNVLTAKFYAELYQETAFQRYIEKVVAAFKDHPALFCWELTNEASNHEDFNGRDKHEIFIDYCNTMAGKIGELDDHTHMITAGVISLQVLEFKVEGENDEPVRLYQNLDFITIHDYQGISDADRHLHHRLNKPLLIEEVGKKGERDGWFRQNMSDWFDMGASGYLGWGFMPSTEDNGDGDEDVGIDRAIHGDYDVVTQIWKDRAAGLPPVPPL